MNDFRSETDSLGKVDVPADKLWGAQTQRSLEHLRAPWMIGRHTNVAERVFLHGLRYKPRRLVSFMPI